VPLPSRAPTAGAREPQLLLRASLLLLLVALAAPAGAGPPLLAQPDGVPWPTRAWPEGVLDGGVDAPGLEQAIDRISEPVGRGGLPDTRALLIVQGGRVVLERYAAGFGEDSRFHSWSMAKSVTQALIGILVRRGELTLDACAPVPEWNDPEDPRHAIRLHHLLAMTTGLDNADMGEGGEQTESYVARLFFGDLHRDSAGAAAAAELVHEPGSHWAYASSMGSLFGRIIADRVGGGRQATLDFMRAELFDPLGIRSLVPEFDASDTYLGGGFVWASARDWARLGLLYLRDGVWDGRRILPEGWVDYTRAPADAPNNSVHTAHWWRNAEPVEGQFSTLRPGFDAFMMSGNAGQYVIVVPDRDLVVVRLGELHTLDFGELGSGLSDIVETFPRVEEGAP
jgi:CubicO group peptidase (beta-lactamase class C family)